MALAPDILFRLGCVALAVAGLAILMAAMVRFEQRQSGRIAALVVGGVLVVGSVVLVVVVS